MNRCCALTLRRPAPLPKFLGRCTPIPSEDTAPIALTRTANRGSLNALNAGGSNSGAAAGIKYFTMAGIALSFISTFFAHGFNTLARKLSAGEAVSRQWLQGSLLSNSALNLWGIGATVIGLQVGSAPALS